MIYGNGYGDVWPPSAGPLGAVCLSMHTMTSMFLASLVGSLGCVLVICFLQGLVSCRNAVPTLQFGSLDFCNEIVIFYAGIEVESEMKGEGVLL